MSMFDFDARPVKPGVVLVGTRASLGAYAIRDFLSRNGYPFEWVDAGERDAVRAVLGVAEVEPSALPLCILPDGSRLAAATVEQVAEGLGMVAAPARSEYDLAIVGAGPAGLAAAVNAASEGLRTVVVEAVAPGGQDLTDHVAARGRCSSRLLFLVCTDRAATLIVPVTPPAADTVPFPVTWRKTPLTGTSPQTLLFFSRTSDLGPS